MPAPIKKGCGDDDDDDEERVLIGWDMLGYAMATSSHRRGAPPPPVSVTGVSVTGMAPRLGCARADDRSQLCYWCSCSYSRMPGEQAERVAGAQDTGAA